MWAMNMPIFYRQVVKGLGATTSPHVNVGDIKRLLVPRPSLDEQLQTGSLITRASGKLKAEAIVKEKLVRQKLGLMQDLLTGKVSVIVDTATPEPALG
jgi:type I restriction enzyme S subunit